MTRISTLARHPLAIVGAVITTASAVVFITLVIADAGGDARPTRTRAWWSSSAIPALFVMGLLLIPAGMWLERRKQLRDPTAVSEWPVVDFRRAQVRRTALLIAALTAVNVVIVLLAGYGGLHAMESPRFCGQACHTPMHSAVPGLAGRVAFGRRLCRSVTSARARRDSCTRSCPAFVSSCMVATNSIPSPIPPGAQMPPGAPGGDVLELPPARTHHRRSHPRHSRVCRRRSQHRDDDGAADAHERHDVTSARAIHWHADPSVRVEYVATDAERQTIPYVRVTDAKGQVKEYVSDGGDRPDSRGRRGRWTASIATTRSDIRSRRHQSRPSIGPSPRRW